MDLESDSDRFSNLQIVDTKTKNQNMEEMNTGRAWGEVVSDGFNIPSYNPKKSSGRKKHKRKESAHRTVGNSTNSYMANDPENLSRQSSLVCTNSESLDMEPSSHAQGSSQEIKSSILNISGRNLSSLDNSRKDASLVSHHSRHNGSKWRKKEKDHFPQNMEEMDTGRAWGDVVSDGFNVPSYNPKKSSGRKKHKRKESACHTGDNSTNSYTTNDPENLSRRSSLICTNSESLDMEPSSHVQDPAQEIKSSIINKSERNLSSVDNSQKDASLVSHHPRHSGSKWRKKEKEHFPQNMEEMDTGRAGGEVVSDGLNIPSYNPKKSSRRKKHKRKESASRTVGNSTNSYTTNDPENLSRHSSLVCTNSESLDTEVMEPSSHAQDSSQETKSLIPNKSERNLGSFNNSQKDASLVSHHPQHSGSKWRKKEREHFPVIDESVVSGKSRDRGKRAVLGGGTLQLGASRTSIWQRKTETNGYISPCNASKNSISNVVDRKYLNTSVIGKPCTSHLSVYDQDDMEATDSQNISHPVPTKGIPRHKHFDAVQKSYGPRRLVQTDHISAYNTAHCNKQPKCDWDWKTGCELSEVAASYRTTTIHDIEHINADRTEAEVLLDHSFESDKQKGKAKSHIGRVCSTPEREVAVISDGESLRSPKDMCGGRTYDITGKTPVYSLQERACDIKKGKDTYKYNCLSDQNCETATGYRDNVNPVSDNQELTASHSISNASAPQTTSMSESENLRCHRRQKLMKGEGKNKSVHFNYHGCSSSTDDVSEVSHCPSYRPSANSKLRRGYDSQHRSTGFGPVIERCTIPLDSSARTSQVESDEILARQLQEQFYNELQSFSGTQVDASIAWSLQQDDAHRSASMDRRSQFNNRDASMDHLYAYYAQLPQSTSNTRTPSSSRRRDNYGTEMDYETRMMAEVRRNFNSGTMGREMRHNLLETLEATFDYSNDMFTENVLQTRSDFDGNDYEMLLALDENNHSHLGASEIQINNLPQSTIQSDNAEEACAICLDPPSLGDVIRLLPCLHKFHKECIDTWLRKRSSCPVCKYDI